VASEPKPVVGLDFGTSTTLVASPSGIVPIGTAEAWMPSVAGYDDAGTLIVGESALDLPDEQVVLSVKRSITEKRSYMRVDTPAGLKDVRADDVITALLQEAARRAVEHGQALTGPGLRLACPAMWDGGQRRRLVEAAGRAGLAVTLPSLVDEPVAAGIAWLAGRSDADTGQRRIVVFDMGGGTLDIAVLDVRGIRHHDVSVLAAIGVPEAGDTLDAALAADIEESLAAMGIDVDSLPHPERARRRLVYEARQAKIGLSTETEHDVALPRRLFGIGSITYRRDQLNDVFSDQMDRAELGIATALRAARLVEADGTSAFDILRTSVQDLVHGVDTVLLSGGMAQVPYVAERLSDMFPATTRIEVASTRADEAVALGLALAPRYGQVSMYRPPFDILLEWDSGQQFRTVYDAFTPLVQPGQIAQGGSDLRYVRNGLELSLPRNGKGRLRLVSHSEDRIRATLGGVSLDKFLVALSEQKFEFSLYPNGRIRLTDGSGRHEGRIESWSA
jgi:molecular chaperone DnaK (HSP70)